MGKSSDPVWAIKQAFDAFFHSLQSDVKHCYSDDGVKEFVECNEFEFLEDGTIW